MAARLRIGAAIGIFCRNGNHMFIHVIAVNMMQMAIMKIIDMAVVMDRGVATAGPVGMDMIVVGGAAHRLVTPLGDRGRWLGPHQCLQFTMAALSHQAINRPEVILCRSPANRP